MKGRDILEGIGPKVAEARVNRRLSQRELAKLVETSSSHISLIEAGNNNPGAIVLRKLCLVLGVSANDLLGISIPFPSSGEDEGRAAS